MDLHISVIHLGEKNFPCKECGKQFGRYTTLRVHMLSHTGERPFQVCKILKDGKILTPDICSATFATLVSRRRGTCRITSQSLIPTALCSRRRTNLLRRIMATPRPAMNMKNQTHYSYQVIVHSPCYRLFQILKLTLINSTVLILMQAQMEGANLLSEVCQQGFSSNIVTKCLGSRLFISEISNPSPPHYSDQTGALIDIFQNCQKFKQTDSLGANLLSQKVIFADSSRNGGR